MINTTTKILICRRGPEIILRIPNFIEGARVMLINFLLVLVLSYNSLRNYFSIAMRRFKCVVSAQPLLTEQHILADEYSSD